LTDLLTKLFPKATEKIWADANWDFPKGTRREEAAALMVEQAAEMVEAYK